jgi:predicted transcriptional regulator
MKETPCEYIIWNGIPVIRREIAKSMVHDFSLNQKQTAEKLGVTPAAISQYLSGKRGNIEVKDNEILKEIKKSAEFIINNNNEFAIVGETCRLCAIMRKKSFFSISCSICNDID